VKPPDIRWAVRGTLILGVAASITANVLHARDNPISQTIAGWPPLALLITVEVVARVPIIRRWLGLVRVCGVAVIAGIAAWVSYWHMAGVALRYGEATGAAHLLPLSVDGLIVVASVCLVELGGRDRATNESEGNSTWTTPEEQEQSEELPDLSPAPSTASSIPPSPSAESPSTSGSPEPSSDGSAAIELTAQIARPRKPHRTNPDRVRRVYEKDPDADPKAVARRLKLSPATVKRYRPPKEQPEQVNGKVPDLEGAKS
jgi:hypothetical protein